MRVEALDTPVLTIDLDAVDRNIARVQTYCDTHGFRFRPHIKTHKLPAIAHLQLRAGAVGITCQKLGEAEVMAAAGIDDILITFPIVGEAKAERLAALAQCARMAAVGDSGSVARGLSRALERAGAEVDFLVECDTGYGRTGVQSPEAALELARLVAELPGLRFAGLMTYPTAPESGPWLAAAREACEQAGLPVERVSGGGTPQLRLHHEIGGFTEVRAGTYVFGDTYCVTTGAVPFEDCALHVRATVVSRPTPDRAIIDAGSKTLSSDPAEGEFEGTWGVIVEYPEARIYTLSEEHGHVDLAGCDSKPDVGDVVTIVPNHACMAVNMHDKIVAHRDGSVVAIWPVAARGRVS